jgi:hypothetical protein
MNTPEMIPSQSSNIESFGHDAATGTLQVKFRNGGVYSYAGVTAEIFEQMKASPSHGKFLAQKIKGKFPPTKHS